MTNDEVRMTKPISKLEAKNVAPPRIALLTPKGRGAVATVAVRGKGARSLVSRRFEANSGQSLESFAVGRVVVGRFHSLGGEEELVIGLASDDLVEIHCHGGVAAAQAIVEALASEGGAISSIECWAYEDTNDAIAA